MIFIAVFAVLVGANTVLCRYLNTIYAKYNGLGMGTLINYITGLATALLVLLVFGDPMTIRPIGALSFSKIMMFFGGALGVVMVQTLIYITPRMPAFLGTMMIFISQLGAGLVLDYAISGTFNLGKLLGGVMVLLGLWHYSWIGKRSAVTASAVKS